MGKSGQTVCGQVSFESHPAHISLTKKSIVVTGVNLVIEVEQQ